MAEYATFELSLRKRHGSNFDAEVRFRPSPSAVEAQLVSGARPQVHLDYEALRALQLDTSAYGNHLTAMLFADPRLREAFSKARTVAESARVPLRISLRLDADDAALHSLAWEALQDPERGGWLCDRERLLLNRYLESPALRPIALRAQADLSACVVVANPSDLATYQLAPIDVAGERQRIQAALGALPTRLLMSGHGRRATFTNISTALRDTPDVLYLVCHGTSDQGQFYLWLEHEDGTSDRVAGAAFAHLLDGLERLPTLIILASCASAGSAHDEHSLAALGPQLARLGVAAVIAMQGSISVATISRLMPAFFHELQQDGQIDRALAVARSCVLDRPDWWMPVLFLRVRDGQVWQAATQAAFEPRMVRVEGGAFPMGSDPARDPGSRADERPLHAIDLSPYRISRTPITNRQYAQFVEETGHRPPRHWHSTRRPPPELDLHPVVYVSYADAQAYCAWLRQKTGTGYRLPTESEWEKAARGTDGRIYPWGNTPPDTHLAQYSDCPTGVGPAGAKPAGASPYGALDMAGNVWEWVADWYDPDAYRDPLRSNRDPAGPRDGQRRVIRGGSWYHDAAMLRAARRLAALPTRLDDTLGFRVAFTELTSPPSNGGSYA